MPGDDLEDLRFFNTKDPRHPIGVCAWGGTIVALCDDGSAWLWGVPARVREKLDEHQRFLMTTDTTYAAALPHEWVPFHQPIPGTPAYAEYSEERR